MTDSRDPQTRLLELAREGAKYRHDWYFDCAANIDELPPNGHENHGRNGHDLFGFETCPHPDCLLVRVGEPQAVDSERLCDVAVAAFIHAEDEYAGCEHPDSLMPEYNLHAPFWCFWNRPKDLCSECDGFKEHVRRHIAGVLTEPAASRSAGGAHADRSSIGTAAEGYRREPTQDLWKVIYEAASNEGSILHDDTVSAIEEAVRAFIAATPSLPAMQGLIQRMRSDKARFRVVAGGSEVVDAFNVDNWADDLEEIIGGRRGA